MPAFNSRLKPKKIGHMPLYAVLGLLLMLVTGVLVVVLPSPFKGIMMLFFGASFVGTGFYFRVGDELPFIGLKLAARRERSRASAESRSEA